MGNGVQRDNYITDSDDEGFCSSKPPDYEYEYEYDSDGNIEQPDLKKRFKDYYRRTKEYCEEYLSKWGEERRRREAERAAHRKEAEEAKERRKKEEEEQRKREELYEESRRKAASEASDRFYKEDAERERSRWQRAEEKFQENHELISGIMKCEFCDKVLFYYTAYKEKSEFGGIIRYQKDGSQTWISGYPGKDNFVFKLTKNGYNANTCKACYMKYSSPY